MTGSERLEELFRRAVASGRGRLRVPRDPGEIRLDVNAVRELVHAALELDHYLTRTAPDHVVTGREAREVARLLNDIVSSVERLSGLEAEAEASEERVREEFRDAVFVVVRGRERKVLRELVERPVVQAGGPLIPEDYREVNPNLPKELPEGIVKAARRARREVEESVRRSGARRLVLVRERGDRVGEVLERELPEIAEELGVDFEVIEVEDFSELSPADLLKGSGG
ncbi:MAG: DUF2100 domain-containing protein [Euryarchaeota archaeon]